MLMRKEEDIIKIAYQTAAFNNSKKKPKALQFYINKIQKAFNKKPNSKSSSNDTVDVQKSREIEKTIEKLKGGV